MSVAEIKAMFSLNHVEALVGMTATELQLTGGTATSRHADAIRIGPGEAAAIGAVTLIAPEGDGIHAEGAAGAAGAVAVAVSVGDVTIDGAGDDGIDVAGRPLHVNPGTTITRPADDGVTIGAGASGTVLSVTIRDCGDAGIESHDGGRFDTIAGCTISGTGGDGIHAEAGRIGSCTVTDTGGNGIVAATDRMQVVGNDVTSPAQDGVRVTGADVYVFTNTVTLAGDAGIRVEGEGAYVNDNVVDSATGDGIVVGGGWGGVTGDTVTNPGGDGICVVGAAARTGAELSENVVEGAAGDGIDLGPATGVRVAANTVTACGDCGIRLGDGAKRNRLTANRASESGSYDLYESDASRKNRIARSNRFRTHRHRGAK
jgi:parallel beta-helix repeat protein